VDYEAVSDFETDEETLSALEQTGEHDVETTLRPR
jgi:Holliday junction DNA helicase RuvB